MYIDVYPYIINDQGEIYFLLLKRKDNVPLPCDWQAVSGKIKENERIKDAFVSQVQSKTGQIPHYVYKLDFINTFYDEHYDSILMVPCAAAKLNSKHIEINRRLHSEYQWATYEEACKLLAWNNQKKCLSLIKDLAENDSRHEQTSIS